MSDACIIAVGAVSALGEGEDAYVGARAGESARVAIAPDPLLADAGLARPFAARAARIATPEARALRDPATLILEAALRQLLNQLDAVRPGFRAENLGIALGTSSGGMLSAERFFAAREAPEGERPAPDEAEKLARAATYFAPFEQALAAVGLDHVRRRTQILAACAASAVALGVGLRWLDRGACDLVIAGGYDAVSVFVAAGFEVLRATTASRPRPFGLGRDGMALGEGAAVVALAREGDHRRARVWGRVAGFGAATDAVHITAPDRSGAGLVRALRGALDDAALTPSDIDLVSAHGTATPFNDAMESRAITEVFGAERPPVVHPFKAQIGHTLGAAGILEGLAAMHAVATSTLPAAVDRGEPDPDAPARLLLRAEVGKVGAAVKLAAAFGGANAAVVFSGKPSQRKPRTVRPVYLRAHALASSVDLSVLAEQTGVARDRLSRLDSLSRWALSAVANLAMVVGRDALKGAGTVVGQALATLDTNARFDARIRARGARFAEPRLFPATSPNATGGECAIVYGMTGPSFAVGASLDAGLEALARGVELVAQRDAERVVVVAADDAGPAARDLLLWSGQQNRTLREGAVALLLDAVGPEGEVALDPDLGLGEGPIGHLGLVAWLTERGLIHEPSDK